MRIRQLLHIVPSLKQIAVFVVVFGFFIVPTFLTSQWLKTMLLGNDPRKTTKIAPLELRPIDQQQKILQPFQEPIISVTFDDGWESVYTNGLPLLQKYGIPTTQYIIAGTFDNPDYLSVSQLSSMQKAGHDIESHTMTHEDLTKLDDEDLNWQLQHSQEVLQAKFGGSIEDFASPLGAYNQRTLAAIRQYYRSHRNTESDPQTVDDNDVNIASEFDPYSIKAYSVRATTTLQDIQRLVDYTMRHNGWLVLTYHQVDYRGETYSVTPQMLEEQLRLISNSKARIATLGKVMGQYQASVEVKGTY